jgi:arylsulfatase A
MSIVDARRLQPPHQATSPPPFLPYILAQTALDFIERSQNSPFFLYFAFQHTHHPDCKLLPMLNSTPRFVALLDLIKKKILHLPHRPSFIDAGLQFFNTTERGMMGDSLASLDSSVGQVFARLDALGLSNNTLVFFSADNGPSLMRLERGGDAGPLRCGKGTSGLRFLSLSPFFSF